jgi:hypothetical protein
VIQYIRLVFKCLAEQKGGDDDEHDGDDDDDDEDDNDDWGNRVPGVAGCYTTAPISV